MLALTGVVAPGVTAAAAVALPVALKAVGELHQHVLMSNKNNVLARQGYGLPDGGEDMRLSRQRSGGISGGLNSGKKEPGFLKKVPSRASSGDTRKKFLINNRGNATSTRGTLEDQLSKVPRRTHGASADYKRANRPTPSRLPGFDNQSYPF